MQFLGTRSCRQKAPPGFLLKIKKFQLGMNLDVINIYGQLGQQKSIDINIQNSSTQ